MSVEGKQVHQWASEGSYTGHSFCVYACVCVYLYFSTSFQILTGVCDSKQVNIYWIGEIQNTGSSRSQKEVAGLILRLRDLWTPAVYAQKEGSLSQRQANFLEAREQGEEACNDDLYPLCWHPTLCLHNILSPLKICSFPVNFVYAWLVLWH